jgi:hypothetical protein
MHMLCSVRHPHAIAQSLITRIFPPSGTIAEESLIVAQGPKTNRADAAPMPFLPARMVLFDWMVANAGIRPL